VPEEYPHDRAQMVIKDHNFEPTFFKVFESQANIIIKRLWNGGLPGYDK
jgi:hypothetical protein